MTQSDALEPDIAMMHYRQQKMTYQDLVDYFKATTFVKPQPIKGDWGDLYTGAEIGPDPFVAGPVLQSALVGGRITQEQYDELLGIALANTK